MLTTQLKRTSKLIAPVVRSGTGSASLAALANVPDERKVVRDISPEACVRFRCRRTGCTTLGWRTMFEKCPVVVAGPPRLHRDGYRLS